MDGFSGMLSYNVVIGTELKRKSEEEKTDLPEAKTPGVRMYLQQQEGLHA